MVHAVAVAAHTNANSRVVVENSIRVDGDGPRDSAVCAGRPTIPDDSARSWLCAASAQRDSQLVWRSQPPASDSRGLAWPV